MRWVPCLWYIVYTVSRPQARLWRRLHYADWLKNVSDIAAYPTTSFRLGCLFTLIQWKTQTCIRKHVVGCKKRWTEYGGVSDPAFSSIFLV